MEPQLLLRADPKGGFRGSLVNPICRQANRGSEQWVTHPRPHIPDGLSTVSGVFSFAA